MLDIFLILGIFFSLEEYFICMFQKPENLRTR